MLDKLWHGATSALEPAVARIKGAFWPLLQATAAATVAWAIAHQIGNHPHPFFAPIAAVIALNAERGQRGLNALRLLSGVFIGIIAAELTLISVGGGYAGIALATFVATLAARAIGGTRIVVAQAASGAILTVATAGGAGINRIVDALIGAGVALVFTQLLFAPEPLQLLRRAESEALAGLGEGLHLCAVALERDDDELSQRAMTELRDVRDQLAALARMRKASSRVVRHSLVWRSRAAPVVQETENAGHLDLLGGSCLMVARTTRVLERDDKQKIAPNVQLLGTAITELATNLSDRAVRQRAADRGLDLVRWVTDHAASDHATVAANVTLRIAATDLMVFAGADQDSARKAIHGHREVPVVPPAQSTRVPFGLKRRRPQS